MNFLQAEDVQAALTAVGFFALMLGGCFSALVAWDSWHQKRVLIVILTGVFSAICVFFTIYFALEILP